MICDFAQFYHIYDLKALPVRTLAVLSFGLPTESRVMKKLSGQELTAEQTLLAAICDNLSLLVWMNTEDSRHGRNRPKSILSELTADNSEKPQSYADGAEFMAARNAILKGGGADGN